ncbi:MAG: GNAT family N-acetyltransferase, partial [Acidobacteriota bacterium]
MHVLDNPVWQSLSTCQLNVAVGDADVKRYLPAMAPFIGVPDSDAPIAAQLRRLVAVDESLYFVGVAPQLPPLWKMEEHAPVVQMLCSSRADTGRNAPEISILSDADIPAMIELTSLVYPEFFRSR